MNTIQTLSDAALTQKIERLAHLERRVKLALLRHLREFERRGLFAHRGNGSMHDYLTRELKFSESSATLRVESMRALDFVPGLESLLATGVVSMTTVAKVQHFVKRAKKANRPFSMAEKRDLFTQIQNKSQSQVDRLLVTIAPELEVKERTRALSSELTQVTFTADAELMEMLGRIKALSSHVDPNPTYLDLFKRMAKEMLKKLDPAREPVRGRKIVHQGKAQPNSPTVESSPGREAVSLSVGPQASLFNSPTVESSRSRPLPDPTLIGYPAPRPRQAVPAGIRRAVWQRDRGECTHRDSAGSTCTSRFQLQLDHARPHALGGADSVENLRLRCATHNRSASAKTGRS